MPVSRAGSVPWLGTWLVAGVASAGVVERSLERRLALADGREQARELLLELVERGQRVLVGAAPHLFGPVERVLHVLICPGLGLARQLVLLQQAGRLLA